MTKKLVTRVLFFTYMIIASVAFSQGTTRDNPIIVKAGTISFDAGNGKTQYYKYTARGDGSITAKCSSTGCGYAANETEWIGNPNMTNNLVINVEAGKDYYIRWKNSGTDDFDWILKEDVVFLGSSCETAKGLSFGTYTFSTYAEDYWVKYEAAASEKVNFSICATVEQISYKIYKNKCSSSIASGRASSCTETAYNIDLVKGDVLIVQLQKTNTNSTFQFTFSNLLPDEGTDCSNPYTVDKGAHTADNSKGNQWFKYIAPEDETIQISSCGTAEKTSLAVYLGSCSKYLSGSSNKCGTASRLDLNLKAGANLYIKWSNSYTKAAYDFVIGIAPGLTCDDAIVVNETGNLRFDGKAKGDIRYFKYTALSDMALVFDDAGKNNLVELISSCNPDAVLKSAEGKLSYDIAKDETVYVKWESVQAGDFEWTISESGDSDGDGVADADDQCPNTVSGADVDENGCELVDSDGDGVADAIDQCPNTVSGANVDENGCEIIVDSDGDGVADADDQCPNTTSGAEVDETGCETSVRVNDVGNGISIYPIPARDNLTIAVSSESEYTVEIRDVHGKRVMKLKDNRKQADFDVSALLPGNYSVTVELEGTEYQYMISKK